MEAFEITFSCGPLDLVNQETSYEFRCIFKHNGDNCEFKYVSTEHKITEFNCNTFGKRKFWEDVKPLVDSRKCVIQLNNVTSEDEGIWSCELKPINSRTNLKIIIAVLIVVIVTGIGLGICCYFTQCWKKICKKRNTSFDHEDSEDPNDASLIIGEPRTAVLHKGKKGFGFVLRGAKGASPLMNMVPLDKCPGLQYMDDVDPAGVADMAGIRKGDFLLEINGNDVRQASHETVVTLIRKSGDLVQLTVVSVSYEDQVAEDEFTFDNGGNQETLTSRETTSTLDNVEVQEYKLYKRHISC